MPRASTKLQRWTDLLAALLRRRYPATFEELAPDIPAYSDKSKRHDALMRMFERDKDELRSFGIAIDTVPFDDGEAVGYKLDRKGFYLPYLSLAAREGKSASKPRKPDKYGYHALASLVLEPDELSAINEAAQRVIALGDPVLAEEARSALRKLAFDLPLPDLDVGAEQSIAFMASLASVSGMAMRESAPPMMRENIFELLNEALVRRKLVSFHYYSMSTDRASRREVEPYGLFFLSSNWYLAGRDREADVRNFRLNRMRAVEINPARAQSGDYEIPSDFNLRAHAKSKRAWELGDSSADDAIVDFSKATGATVAAARLGVAVEGAGDRRKFRIRRVDSFARWLLSFGGEAVPLEPPALVSEFERQVDETHAVYGGNR
ncbi:MAG: WYL domain-containing protein [Gemmatimonadaceae bacterium]